jgi:hypothetical protein
MDEKEEEEEAEEEITKQRTHGPRGSKLRGMSKRRPWVSAEGDRRTGDVILCLVVRRRACICRACCVGAHASHTSSHLLASCE